MRREKTGSDVCTESVFLGKLIMGMSVGKVFESLFYGNLFWVSEAHMKMLVFGYG